MKQCQYCAEEIQNDAIKCKHCNEILIKESQLSNIVGSMFGSIFSVVWKTLLVILVLLYLVYACVESM